MLALLFHDVLVPLVGCGLQPLNLIILLLLLILFFKHLALCKYITVYVTDKISIDFYVIIRICVTLALQ